MTYRRTSSRDEELPGCVSIVGMVVAAVVLVSLAVFLFSSMKTISPGYVGIVFDKQSHTVTTEAVEPGWKFINPLTQSIQSYPVTVRTYDMLKSDTEGPVQGDDSVKVQSSEGQQLNLDVVIQYQVNKVDAGKLYADWGGADIGTIEDRVVRQYTRSIVPAISSSYGWEKVLTGRQEIEAIITEQLNKEFSARHINLVTFNIREVHLPENLQKALDVKIQAQQAAEQQKYQLEQAKIKAEQDVAEAQGKANALKAQAEGEANATLVRAKAQAEANKLLSQSLTSELVQYRLIDRWDGKLPTYSGSATPMITLPNQ